MRRPFPDSSPYHRPTSRTRHPTVSTTSSLFGSITFTSVSLQTNVVMRRLVSGVRNLM